MLWSLMHVATTHVLKEVGVLMPNWVRGAVRVRMLHIRREESGTRPSICVLAQVLDRC